MKNTLKKYARHGSSFYLTTILTLIVISVGCESKQNPSFSNKIEYTKEAVFPKIEGLNLGTFEQDKGFKMTNEVGQKLLATTSSFAASKVSFRINADMKMENETWFQSTNDPSASVHVNVKNGDYSFNSGTKDFIGDKPTPGLLKSDAALKQSRDYIRQLNLPVKDNELVVVHVGGVNKAIQEGGKSAIFEKFTTVRFDRQLDSIPVFGHSRIVFNLAQEGRIQTLISQWTPFTKQDEKKEALIVQTDSMRMQVEKAILSENPKAQKIRLESIKLVYFDDGSGIVEPALHIQGKTLEGEKDKIQEFPYDVVVPLLKSARLRYSFQHDRFDKRPNDVDNSSEQKRTPRSPDDQKK